MVTAPNPLHAAASDAGPVVYYSERVLLAMILTPRQKLGAPEATPGHSAKDSKNIFERDSNFRTKKNLRTSVRSRIRRFERRLNSKDYNACLQGLEKSRYRHQSTDTGLAFFCQHH